MANLNVNVIGLNDQLGDNNIELSNVGGELVVQTIVDLNSTSQPKKVVTVTDVNESVTALYSTNNTEITSIPTVTDTYFTDESVSESGQYLVEYEFLGNHRVFKVVHATGVETELTDNKSFIVYKSSQIVTVVYSTSVSDGTSTEVTSILKTLSNVAVTFSATAIQYNNSDPISGGTSDVKAVLTGTRKLTITKLS